MIKTYLVEDFGGENYCKYAVDTNLVFKHLRDESELVEYLEAITQVIVGEGMRNDLNLYGMSTVAQENGADLYTRGEHGIMLIDASYDSSFGVAKSENTDLTELPKAPEPSYN